MHHPFLLLFSFDLLHLAFSPHFDPNQHILIDQPTPATFKVLKSAEKLKPLFNLFQQTDIVPVCYSSKSFKQTAPVMSSINPALKWAYVHVDHKNLPNVRPNHARLSKSNQNIMIEYGEGFSACEGKQQLRIAINSAFKLGLEQSRQKLIIFEDNAQQIVKLKQLGYTNIYSEIPDQQGLIKLEAQISRISKEPLAQNKQFSEFVSNASIFNESACRKILGFHYFQNRKSILPTVSLGSSNNAPIYRLPKSTSVCAMVFRYAGDKQFYIGKAQLTSKIGGDLQHELQQNRVLQGCLHQTLTQISSENENLARKFLCLPMYISHFTMKNCLIKAYNKQKAHFVVKPYFKNLKKFSQVLTEGKQIEEILNLAQLGTFKQQRVTGLGSLLCLGILFGEAYKEKGFLQTVALLPFDKNQQQDKPPKLQLLRIQFTQSEKDRKLSQFEDLQVKLLSYPQVTLKIGQLCNEYMQQFKQTVSLICQSLPIIASTFSSQVWNFSKKTKLTNFVQNAIFLGKKFGMIHGEDDASIKTQLGRMDISKIHPKFLNYLVASSEDESFDYFTSESSSAEMMYEYAYDRRNQYEQNMAGINNFAIFGQCIPALSFIKWIKSMNRNCEVVYLSLLTHKSEEYVKQVKMAKAAKKNILFILDHCEIQQMSQEVPENKLLVNSNWGLRTIFMYRLKFGSCKNLVVVHDPLTAGKNNYSAVYSKLPESHEQIFKTIFKFARIDSKQQNKFENYKEAISLYVKNKWVSLGLKAGISELSEIMDKLKLLVKTISLKSNRLASILKSKQFNQHKSLTMSQLTMVSSNQLVQHESEQMANENRLSIDHLKSISRAQLVLYCLPIFVSNQRVWLLHDIHEYLSAYYLQEQIMQGTWNGILEGQQLQIFTNWFDLMDKKQIKDNLIKMIGKFERQKSSSSGKPQIMGANSSLNDCLELLKKIGANHLFCKLDGIFYSESPIIHIEMIQSQLLIAVTEKCGVYQITREVQKQQSLWKMKLLVPQQKNKCYFVGSQRSGKDKEKITLILANFNKSGAFVIQDDNLLLKCIDAKVNEIKTRMMRVKLNKMPQTSTNPVVKIIMIEDKVGVFIFQSGNIIINTLSHPQNVEKEQFIGEQIQLQQKIVQLKIGKTRKVKLNYKTVKHQYQVLQDGSMKIVVAFLNQQHFIQNSIEQNQIVVVGFKICYNSEVQKWCADVEKQTSLICENEIKSIGIGYSDKGNGIFQVMAFQQITDALMIWKLDHSQSEISKVYKPDRKLYRIQNDPIGVYKYGDTLYVASKYSFVKRMQINNPQE